jgi:hypothetical protein
MRIASAVLAAATVALLSGCATPQQPAVGLGQETLSPKSGRIGVVMTALPKVDTRFPGADCLLCMAAANATNSTLTSHTQTLSHEDLPKLKDEMATLIRKKGVDVMVIGEELKLDALPEVPTKGPNIATKDHSALRAKYNVDKLLVIDISTLGIMRPYSAYVPTGAPRGILEGRGYIVNLSNNSYEWYQRVQVYRAADGQWDEPPKFPGLTNAYFQVLELGKDDFLKPFSQ